MVRYKEAYNRLSRQRAIVRLKNAARYSKNAWSRKQARLSLARMQQRAFRNWGVVQAAARKNVARMRAKKVVRRFVRRFRERRVRQSRAIVNRQFKSRYG